MQTMTRETAKGKTPSTVTRFLWARLVERGKLRWARLTARQRSLPDFLIIGAQKCGTSSLLRYLWQHPIVKPCLKKEVHFFNMHYAKGENWYRSHFPKLASESTEGREQTFVTGESSPSYLSHPPSPGRVKQMLPNVKLMIMLRNPIDRAYSHFHAQLRRGREKCSFEEALAKESERLDGEVERMREDETYDAYNWRHYGYQTKGIYVDQIERWLNHFPRTQLWICDSAKLYREPNEVMPEVLEFLGLPPCAVEASRAYNAGRYQAMQEETRCKMRKYFAPYNERLNKLLKQHDFLQHDLDWD